MKVAHFTGAYVAGRCGVGDYTDCLAAALNSIGVETHVIRATDRGALAAPQVSKNLRRLGFDIVHIQYPTAGFGAKLGPQALAVLHGCVITIHEASRASFLRRLSLIPFLIRPRHVIFSSDVERNFFASRAPWISGISSVIPIGSNIGGCPQQKARSAEEIVHFGLIRPRKGLEEVLKLAKLIKLTGVRMKIRIIGRPPAKHVPYFESLKSTAAELPVIWDCDLSELQVAQKLGSAAIGYLPYPDGASERRASLKAMLINGVSVITTRGPDTPPELETLVRFTATPEEALSTALSLLDNPDQRATLADKSLEYGRRFAWERIAELHSNLYLTLLGSSRVVTL